MERGREKPKRQREGASRCSNFTEDASDPIELKAARRKSKVTELSPGVFIHNGHGIDTIRRPFELAREKARVKDLHSHDLRRTEISRWAMAGIPQGAIMAAAGHHSLEMHNRYVNVSENQLRQAFELFPGCSQENSIDEAKSTSC